VRRFATFSIVLVALVVLPVRAAAQEATPSPALDIPAPEECTVAPRTFAELQALVATPVAVTPTPAGEGSPTPFALPAGTPADEATTEEVRSAIRELVACINAGDFWRVIALYSDRYVQFFLSQGGELTEEAYSQYATPVPLPPEQQIAIVEYRDVVVLPDGRIAAVVVGDDPTDDEPAGPTLFYLVKTGDRWLVDDFVDVPE
jgi:ketosteroid isomerase-like protein